MAVRLPKSGDKKDLYAVGCTCGWPLSQASRRTNQVVLDRLWTDPVDRRFQRFSACWTIQPSGPPHRDPVHTAPGVRVLPRPAREHPFLPPESRHRPSRPPEMAAEPDVSMVACCHLRDRLKLGPFVVPGCVHRDVPPPRSRLASAAEHDLAPSIPRGSHAPRGHLRTETPTLPLPARCPATRRGPTDDGCNRR